MNNKYFDLSFINNVFFIYNIFIIISIIINYFKSNFITFGLKVEVTFFIIFIIFLFFFKLLMINNLNIIKSS